MLFSRSAQGNMKRALPSSDPTFEASTDLSRKWEPESDEEKFETLLRYAKEQRKDEDKEELEEEIQNLEASTEADVLSYDEIKWGIIIIICFFQSVMDDTTGLKFCRSPNQIHSRRTYLRVLAFPTFKQ